jgi:hypothetical protein
MRSRVLSLLLGAALVASAAPSLADDEPEPKPPEVVSVDYASIPVGALPPLPAEADTPKSAPKARVMDLKLEPIAEKGSPKRPSKRLHKKNKKVKHPKTPHMVEVRPAAPSLGLLYTPTDASGEVDGESFQRMQCGNRGDAQPLRWEKLTLGPDGTARLQIDDVWFDSKSCSLWPGSSSVTTLKPVAWQDGKPWLYAVRSDSSVTFVMPRSNEASAETMVGSPVAIRGEFTRVTLPLGRWGAGSISASLPALAISTPPPANVHARKPAPVDEGEKSPVELAVEVVQTMAERYPTLLVRTRDAVPPSPSFE